MPEWVYLSRTVFSQELGERAGNVPSAVIYVICFGSS